MNLDWRTRHFLLFLSGVMWLVAQASCGSVLTPSSGPAGTEVEVKLAGLDSAAVTSASLGAVAAPIVSRGVEFVRITIPAAAMSGPVTLHLGADSRVTPATFEVLRVVPVSVAAGFSGMTALGSLYGDASGGTVNVARGRATLVFASNGTGGPALLAMATDADATITLSAATTARAALFLSSLVFTTDGAEASARLQSLAGLAEVAALAATIQTEVMAGRDYSAAPAFDDQLEAALTAHFTPPSALAAHGNRQARAAGVSGTVSRELIVEPKLDRVQPTELSEGIAAATGLPILEQKFGAAPIPQDAVKKFLTANPLDTAVCLYALNISDSRLNTRAKAMALRGSYSEVYNRIAPDPLDKVIIASEPVSRYGAVVELARDWLGKKLLGKTAEALGFAPKNTLHIPDDAPGLYMVRTFNGARFDRQSALLDNLPGGRREHYRMLALNIMMSVTDAVAFFLTDQVVSSDEWAKIIVKLEKSVGLAIERQTTLGTLDVDSIKAIIYATAKTAYEVLFDLAKKKIGLTKGPHLGGLLDKLVKAADRVAAAFKFIERVNAITNGVQIFADNLYTIQSVEDTLFIVGDPWAPRVTAFHPQRGRRGSKVAISGSGFSTVAEENIVTFGYAGTSPEAPPVAVRAEVLNAFSTSLLVVVPPEANTGSITVHVVNKGTMSTASLRPPFQQFTVTPDAILTSVTPSQATPGQPVRLSGLNFASLENNDLYEQFHVVFTLGSQTFPVPLSATSTDLIVTAPFTAGTGTVRVRYGEFGNIRESNELTFTVIPSVIPQTGAEIRFEPTPDGNTRDDRLTLREALMLKNGTLSYGSLTKPPDPRPPTGTWETDYVTSDAVGTEVKNKIYCTLPTGTHTLNLTSSLPPLVKLTTLAVHRFSEIGPAPRFVVNGNGAATGFVLDNVRDVSVIGFHLKNFSSAAILVTGGSTNNGIGCTIEGGDGHGVHILDNASYNYFFVPVSGVGGDGYRLSGPNVFANEITVVKQPDQFSFGSIEFCEGWGIRIENGAHLNRILAPVDSLFIPPPSGGIVNNGLGGILVTGSESRGNTIHQMYSVGLPIAGNGGPGIRIESPETTIFQCRITGNTGAGIEFFSPAAAGSRVSACTIGYFWDDGTAGANTGHGIHLSNTRDIRIGEDIIDPFFAVLMNGIAANGGHGILLENTQAITVQSTQLGRVPLEAAAAAPVDLPNVQSGVVLQNSSDCTLGSVWYRARLQVTGHLNGSGIRLLGEQSKNNTIISCYLGYDSNTATVDLGNNIGVEVVDGAWGNRIGMGGEGTNFIFFNRQAGVLIDAGGDPLQTIPPEGFLFNELGGNVVMNSRIQQNHDAGVLLLSRAKVTQIGGPGIDANTISANGKVGVKISGATASRPGLGNRVVGNTLFGNGITLAGADPLQGAAEGVGILVLDSTWQRVGGDRTAEGNRIGNTWAAVLIKGGENHLVANNSMSNCRKAGLILRETMLNQAGPNNEITDCGVAGFGPVGGIAVSEGGPNAVIGNRIGSFRDGTARAIQGDGILVRESFDNTIGGHGTDTNLINNATGYGVRVTGAASTANHISGNWIGENPGPGVAIQPNAGGGVVLENGAHGNEIGGTLAVVVNGAVAQLPAGNFIRHNGGTGVRVDGAATVSNSITDNSITANGGAGITLVAGGNRNLLPPVLMMEPGRISGTSVAANGSVVQFFQDPDGEGAVPLGIETTVLAGAFQIPIPALFSPDQITATVTNAGTFDTSPFAVPVGIPPPDAIGLRIFRPGGAPATRSAAPGATVMVLPLQCEVLGDVAARIMRLKFDFTGTATSAVAEAALYRDANRNGVIDFGDTRVGAILTAFAAGAEFTGPLAVVQPGEPSQLLFALKLAAGATNGQEIEFRLPSTAGVTAIAVIGPAPVNVTGVFPAVSDRIAVNQSAPLNNFTPWAGSYFTLDELQGIGAPDSDADGDGLRNLLEYFTGTNPQLSNASPAQISAAGAGDTLTFTHLNRPDVIWAFEESSRLDQWGPLNFGTLLPPVTLGDGSVRETVTFSRNRHVLYFRVRAALTVP